jgi:tetratricopeptide (TPR) repeat protein
MNIVMVNDKIDMINSGDYKVLIRCLAEAYGIEDRTDEHIRMAEDIHRNFRESVGPDYENTDISSRHEALFKFSWEYGSRRNESRQNRVFDALKGLHSQCSDGDCYSFTGVYTILSMIEGLNIGVMLTEDCSKDDINHVTSFFNDGERTVQLENTSPNGFDVDPENYKKYGYVFKKHEPSVLVSTAYYNIGRGIVGRTIVPEETKKAMWYLEKAIEFDPSFYSPYLDLGLVHAILDNREFAFDSIEKARKINPNSSMVDGMRGNVNMFLKNFDEAKKDLYRAAVKNPMRHSILGRLADTELKCGNSKSAIVLAGLAISIEPDNKDYLTTQLHAHFELGNYTETNRLGALIKEKFSRN